MFADHVTSCRLNGELRHTIESLKRRVHLQDANEQANLTRQRLATFSTSSMAPLPPPSPSSFEYDISPCVGDEGHVYKSPQSSTSSSSSSSSSSCFESPRITTPEKKASRKTMSVTLAPGSPGSMYTYATSDATLKAARLSKWKLGGCEDPVSWSAFLKGQGLKEMTNQGWQSAFTKAKAIYGHNTSFMLNSLVFVRTISKSNAACVSQNIVVSDSVETRKQVHAMPIGSHAVMLLRSPDEMGNYRTREIGGERSTLSFSFSHD